MSEHESPFSRVVSPSPPGSAGKNSAASAAPRPPQRKRRWLRRLLWAFLCLFTLALVALHYVTRETFIRDTVLRRILGPEYDRNLKIGRVQIDVFPPSLEAFNIQLLDRRPGPDEPRVVAELGKLAFDFRLLPPNTLVLDRIEARGLDMRICRDETGQVNLLRALGDMQQGRVPPPIDYSVFAGAETSARTVLLDQWSAGNWRIILEDRYRRSIPRVLKIDLAELRVLRALPDEPLNLANGLPLGVEGYLRYTAGAKEETICPLEGEVGVTNPLSPSRMGASVRARLKPSLAGLAEQWPIVQGLLRRDQPVPDWPPSLRGAPVAFEARGTYAGGVIPRRELSELGFAIREIPAGNIIFEIRDVEYNMRTGRMQGKFLLDGTPEQALDALEKTPFSRAAAARICLDALRPPPSSSHTTPTLPLTLDVQGVWVFEPEPRQTNLLSVPHRVEAFSFCDVRGQLSLTVAAAAGRLPAPAFLSTEPGEPARLETRLRADAGLSWPELNLRLRTAEAELLLDQSPSLSPANTRPSETSLPAGPAPSPPLLLLRGRLDNPPFLIPLPRILAGLREHSDTTPAVPESAPDADASVQARDTYDRLVRLLSANVRRVADRLSPLNRPPVVVRLESPPISLTRLPWVARAVEGLRGVDATSAWRATAWVFPSDQIDVRFQAEGQLAGIRATETEVPIDATLRLNGSLSSNLLEVDRLKLEIIRPPENIYELGLSGSRIDLDTGEGDLHLHCAGLDRGFVDEVMRFGGPPVRQWADQHHNAIGLLEYTRSDLAGSATVSLRLDCHIEEQTLVNAFLDMDNLSLRRFRSMPDREARFDLKAQSHFALDRSRNTIALGLVNASLGERGASIPRVILRRTSDEPVLFPSRRTPELLESALRIVDETIAEVDGPATYSLARAPTILEAFRQIGERILTDQPLELEVRWNRFRWTRLRGVLRELGLPFVEGAGDLNARLRLHPKPPPSSGRPSPEGVADWQLSAALRDLKFPEGEGGLEAALEARGRFTSQALHLESFVAEIGQSTLRMQGMYDLVHGTATLNAGVANLGSVGLKTLSEMRGHRIAEIMKLERRLPPTLLSLAGGGAAPRFELSWNAEQDRWGRRLRLQYNKTTRNLGDQSQFFHGLQYQTSQTLEFDGVNRVALTQYDASLGKGDAAAPIVVARLVGSVALSRRGPDDDWIEASTGKTPLLQMDLNADLAALARQASALLHKALDRGVSAGTLSARLVSPLLPTGDSEITASLSGAVESLIPEASGQSFDFSFEGALDASLKRIALRTMRLTPRPASYRSGEIRLEAMREFNSGNHLVDCRVENADASLLQWLAGRWRPFLSSPDADASLAVHIAGRDRGRYEDHQTTFTARRAALGDKAPASSPSGFAPLHPPVRIRYAHDFTADRVTSTILLRNLALEVAPEDPHTTYVLVDLDLPGPLVFTPADLSFLPPPGVPSPPRPRLRCGPVPLDQYSQVLTRWVGTPPLTGVFQAEASLLPRSIPPAGRDTLISGAVNLQAFDIQRPQNPSPLPSEPQAPTAGALESTASAGPDKPTPGSFRRVPLNASIQFDLRSRAGVVTVDRLGVTSPNPAGIPDDRFGVDGLVFTRRKGFNPDIRIQGEFVNLSKYWDFFSEGLVRKEARDHAQAEAALRDTVPSMDEPPPAAAEHGVEKPASPDSTLFGPARIRLLLDRARFRKAGMRNLTALLRYENQRLQLPEVRAEMGAGALEVTGVVDFAAQPGMAYQSRWTFKDVPLGSLAELFAPSLAAGSQGDLSGEGRLEGRGITRRSLNRHLLGQYSLQLDNGRLHNTPGGWLLGTLDGLSARVDTRISGGTVDLVISPADQDARKAVWLQGYIKDLFGLRRLQALARLELRTVVGPPPPKGTGRLEPPAQNLVGVLCRIAGPIDSPEAMDVRVESYDF